MEIHCKSDIFRQVSMSVVAPKLLSFYRAMSDVASLYLYFEHSEISPYAVATPPVHCIACCQNLSC